jgi:hypothetical protein
MRKTQYTPRTPQGDVGRYLSGELERITNALESGFVLETLEKLNQEPTRKRAGMVVYADGVNWSPGGLGEGIYCYYAGSWKRLG